MKFEINNDSNRKQYIERDNLLLVDNDELVRIDCTPERIDFRMGALFEAICGLLDLTEKESQLLYIATYFKEDCESFYKMTQAAAKIFKCHPRSYYPYYANLVKRGIITTSNNGGRKLKISLSKNLDVSQFKDIKYIVLKIK